MRIKLSIALITLSLALYGCSEDYIKNKAAISTKVAVDTSVEIDGIKVTKIGVINDSTAYGSERAVYRITDSKTGKEFIGISGVGISETGTHRTGKAHHQDER
jgi:hypothetical protein